MKRERRFPELALQTPTANSDRSAYVYYAIGFCNVVIGESAQPLQKKLALLIPTLPIHTLPISVHSRAVPVPQNLASQNSASLPWSARSSALPIPHRLRLRLPVARVVRWRDGPHFDTG